MKTPGHPTIISALQGGTTCLLAFVLLALFMFTPACNGNQNNSGDTGDTPNPNGGISTPASDQDEPKVHPVAVSCETCSSSPTGCLRWDPHEDIVVREGDFVTFISLNKDITLEFDSKMTGDTRLELKSLKDNDVDLAVLTLRVKQDAKQNDSTGTPARTSYQFKIARGSTDCWDGGPTDHPPIIVNGPE